MAAAKLKGAEADYRLAMMRKRLSLIRAPPPGILGRIPNKQGSLIEENNLLTSLSDNTKVLVYFNISETDYLDFRLHPERYAQNPLQLVLANGEVFPARGKILDLGGQFDSSTGTIAIRASFDNPHSLLRNGETGTDEHAAHCSRSDGSVAHSTCAGGKHHGNQAGDEGNARHENRAETSHRCRDRSLRDPFSRILALNGVFHHEYSVLS